MDKKLINFIWAQNEWVDKNILERLNSRDAGAVNEALEQIHARSLEVKKEQQGFVNPSKRSFSDVLQDQINTRQDPNYENLGNWKQVTYRKTKKDNKVYKNAEIFTIFLHDIPEAAQSKEIWQLFQACGQIRDIILPRKRDRNGKRIGFVQTHSEKEAGAVISNAKMDKRLGRKIRMSINTREKEDVRDTPRHKENDRKEKIEKNQKDKEEMCFGKKMFEFIEVEIDEQVEEALLESKIGYTWLEMRADNLLENLIDMGLGKYKVISLSASKFLIRKEKKDTWEELERVDLSAWFCKIRNYEEADHILSRIVWLECRGLPMPA